MLTLDDVVYMIMTDRFADGDPANNHTIDSAVAEPCARVASIIATASGFLEDVHHEEHDQPELPCEC